MESNSSNSSQFCWAVDNSFGPHASHCRGGFDFTLLFEESILSILPLALLLIIAPFRISYLFKKDRKVESSPLLGLKLSAFAIFAGLQLVLVVLWSKSPELKTQASVPTAALTLAGSLVFLAVSYVEHINSVRPSFLLSTYLFSTVIFDIARTRTLWLMQNDQAIAIVFSATLAFKVVILSLEAMSKREVLRLAYEAYPPEATGGLFSTYLFLWLNRLFRRGYSNLLLLEDLFPLDKHLFSQYVERLLNFRVTKGPSEEKKTPTLFAAIMGAYKRPLLAGVLPRVALIALNFTQPFLIERAVKLSLEPVDDETTNIGYGLIGAYAFVYTGIAITTGQYQHETFRAITMIRGGLISLLYGKTADLPINAVQPEASLTLMNADIERISNGFQFAHDLWANIIEMALATYLLERQLGPSAAIPVGVAVLSIFASAAVSGFVVTKQKLWLEAIERRIAVTTSMLGSMKNVKLSGLSTVLSSSVQTLRVTELEISKGFRKLLIWALGFTYITPVAAPILTFATFALVARSKGNDTIDVTKAFTSLSLFVLLATPLGSFIMSLTSFMGAVGCFDRIHTFLKTEARVDPRARPIESSSKLGSEVSSTFEKGSGLDSLHEVKQPLERIKELVLSDTTAVAMHNGSFGWDKEKDPILRNIDFKAQREQLTAIIGPVGCGKSTLLQAILGEVHTFEGSVQVASQECGYCQQTPWLMNGTICQSIIGISDFDQHWYSTVIRACALEQDLRQMPSGDKSLIGSRGITLSGGQAQRVALARAIYARKDLMIFDDVLRGLDADTENQIWHNLFGSDGLLRNHRTTVIFTSSAANRLPYFDYIVALDSDGTIAEQGTFEELNKTGGYVAGFLLSPSKWAPAEDRSKTEPQAATDLVYTTLEATAALTGTAEAEANRRTGDLSIYLYYSKAIGVVPSVLFIVMLALFVFCFSFPNIWLKWWAQANAEQPNQRLDFYLGIYAMFGGASLIFLMISCWLVIITMVPKSGEFFHWILLRKVLGAPMSFFSTTDTGVTLNRFSQDLQLIDMDLPVAALNTSAALLLCVAQLILIAVASIYAAAAFPFCILAFYYIQRYYLRTSRQLRFMDIEAKSPLYSLFVECLSGLATVRAFGWQKQLAQRNELLLDVSQKPFYLLWAVQRWLTVVLDLVVAAIAVLLMVLVVKLRGTMSAGYVGVALVNIITFNQSIKLLVTYWTTLETHIGAIARIRNFEAETATENLPTETNDPPPYWPSEGSIEFEEFSASYKAGNPVLHDISLSIEPGERVAICGRTGSGKSSMVLSIFRMMESTSGSILIDGVDISTIPRQEIRSKLICVPQDAYLLFGTVRFNLDPHGLASDEMIEETLRKVQLWDTIESKGGLDAEVDEKFLSHGQKQLFCLGRAILRQGQIVILDESTSSVDENTDALMQQLIREEFEGRTIISVAHKLETVLDFDKVVVLDNGEIIESGNPRLLLSANSAFCKLYNTYRATRGDSGEAEEPATSEPLAAPAVIGEKHESMTEERLAEWGISFPER